MGVLAVRQFIEDGSTGGLSGSSCWPWILKPVIPGDGTTRIGLHKPCYLCCPLLEAAQIRVLSGGWSIIWYSVTPFHSVGLLNTILWDLLGKMVFRVLLRKSAISDCWCDPLPVLDVLSQVLTIITDCHCYTRDRSGLAGYAVLVMHTSLSQGNNLISRKQKKCYGRSSADSLLKSFFLYFHSQIRKL